MAENNKIITLLSPADLVAVLRETAGIAVLESAVADGKPVIQAAVKAVNAQTGEVLAGGLPFSVVMFKSGNETGYSNIAIGTVVPAAELDIRLPADYFNFCNQRLRFVRVFPLDAGSFVIQMDLVLRNTTREYLKFNFGLWGMLFKQVLYELIGRGRESLVHAAEVYAATDVAQHYVTTLSSAEEAPEPSLGQGADAPQATTQAEEPLATAVGREAAQEPKAETHDYEARSENTMMMADPAEGKDEPEGEQPASLSGDGFAVTLLDTNAAAEATAGETAVGETAVEDKTAEPLLAV